MKKIPLELTVAVLLVITVIIMSSAGYLTYRNMSSMVSSIQKQARPDLSLLNLKVISSNLTDADNSVRLYMVTGDEEYLKPYYEIISRMDSSINLLYFYSRNNPEQIPLNDSVSHLIADKFEVWDQLLNLRNDTKVTRALDLLSSKFLSKPQKDSAGNSDGKNSVVRRFFSKKRESEVPEGIEPSALKEELTQIEKMQAQDSLKQAETKKEELRLLQQDRIITTQLTSRIREIENDENINFRKKAMEADQSSALTYHWLVLFGVSVLLLLMIVLLVIINFVRKTGVTQKALTQAKNEAENLAKAKELFVANVSHEMKSPMNAISGISEQLMEFPVEDRMKEQLTVIRKSSDHLLAVINEILDFSKLQAGKIDLEKIDFYLSDVVEEVLQVNRVLAGKKQLDIRHSIENDVPELLIGDPVRLKQVLHNLMGNAIKFTEYGMVSLDVHKKESDDKLVLLEISVSDTGIGIEDDKLEAIFGAFSQEETSTTRQYGGTGLGLSIVKQLVELMGGTIRVESQKQVGSVFTVIVPFTFDTDSSVKKKPEADIVSILPDFGNLHVLVADDEEYNKVLLRMIFEKWNVKFSEVSNGKEAVEALARQHFDLILMDVRMPVMDGISATRIITEDYEEKSRPKIIGVSATSTNADIKQCKDAGMVDFVSKPYREESLKKVMVRVTGISSTKTRKKDKKPDHTVKSEQKLDLKELYHLGNGDQQFIYDLLKIFIRNSETALALMGEALERKEWEKMADAAHRLASPSLHLRAHNLHQLLKTIETNARNNLDTDKLKGLLERAAEERQSIVVLIKKHMSEIKKLI